MLQTNDVSSHHPPVTTPILQPLSYCLYARKSSEDDERQAMSIDSQIKEMLLMAQKEGLNIAEVRRESHSAKDSGARPVFNELVEDIRAGKFNAIVCWATDRLSRNAGDLGKLVDMMDQGHLLDIRTHGQRFTNSPNEKFLLMILGSQAKLENDHRGVNVKRGLKSRAELGHRPCMPPLGFMLKPTYGGKNKVIIDPKRAPVVKEVFEKMASGGESGRTIYMWLKEEVQFVSHNNKPLALSNLYTMLNNTYYYGEFEYPQGSGKWFKGDYEPIITKELFDKAQKQMKAPPQSKAVKEFDFVKMLKCGNCGYGITAEEHVKRYKSGKSSRWVYYRCTQQIKKICRQPFLREEELLEQLIELIENVSIDQIGARKKLENEVLRFKRFSEGVLGQKGMNEKDLDIDIRNYAKYILREGSRDEKREILSCLKSKIFLKDKKIFLK